MKNILIIAIASLLFSCNDKDESNVIPPPDNHPTDTIEKINPAAVLSVRIDEKIETKSLTYDARFITLYARDYTLSGWIKDISGYATYWRNRDTVENKITFMGWDVVAVIDSTYLLGPFISSEDIILRIAIDSSHIPVSPLDGDLRSIVDYDTVSYIPNTVMRKNQKVLDSLFNAKDYQSCYQMFDTAYHFIPITGAEWRKLKKEGIE